MFNNCRLASLFPNYPNFSKICTHWVSIYTHCHFRTDSAWESFTPHIWPCGLWWENWLNIKLIVMLFLVFSKIFRNIRRHLIRLTMSLLVERHCIIVNVLKHNHGVRVIREIESNSIPIISISYTLSREYRVARYRYSRLLFTSEDRLCANLRVQWQ